MIRALLALGLIAGCDVPPPDRATGAPGHTDTAPDLTGPVVTIRAPAQGEVYDECGEVCFEAAYTVDGVGVEGLRAAVEVDGEGVVVEGETDADGRIAGCSAGFSPGQALVAYTFWVDGQKVRDYGALEVRPFGYDLGLDRPDATLDAIPWTPVFERSASNPVYQATDPWESAGVLLGSVVADGDDYVMAYAGTPAVDYLVGSATSSDGLSWRPSPNNPVAPPSEVEGDWKAEATNSPMLLKQDGLFLLYYTGRRSEGDLSIGLATSTDGLRFTDLADNPVFEPDPDSDWEGGGVAHPSILVKDGFYELWYSTNLHQIGYALSPDGLSWTRYCHNPVLQGDNGTWEHGQVKSAEVAWDGLRYVMTYSGGGSGSFQVGWAVSDDGLRWVKADEPVLAPGEAGAWDSQSVLGASLVLEDDRARVWYSGTNPSGSAIGYAEAAR